MVSGQAEDGLERDMAVIAPVVTEDELIEVGVDVLAAEPMIGAETPALQKGEDPMNPAQGDMRGHIADDAGIVPVSDKPGVGGVPIANQSGAGGDVGLDEGVDIRLLVAGDHLHPAAARQGVEVFRAESLGFLRLSCGFVAHLDGADHDDLALLERLAGFFQIVERHFRLVDLDHAIERIAIRIDHRPPQLLFQQPSCPIGDAELPGHLPRRHPIGMRRHQVGGTEPRPKRKAGPMHDGSGGRRRLRPTVPARESVGAAGQAGGVLRTAFRANEATRPSSIHQQPVTAILVGKPYLEVEKGQLLRHGREHILTSGLSQGA